MDGQYKDMLMDDEKDCTGGLGWIMIRMDGGRSMPP